MSKRVAVTVLGVFSVGVLLAGCGDVFGPSDGPSLQAELIRLPGTESVAALSLQGGPVLSPADGEQYEWSSDLTLTSFRSPIRAISLNGESESSLIYECEADNNDGCLVDLAGPALRDLLGAEQVTVNAGTYTEVQISTCEEEGEYHAFLTGQVEFGDITWVTKTSGVLDTTGTAEPVQLDYTGCARNYVLPEPLVLADTAGELVSVKLYFDIRDIAWASLGGSETGNGWIPSGCAGPRPEYGSTQQPYLCAGYPDVAGTVDDVEPTIERYRINNAATLGLIFTGSSGDFVGGFTRRYFEAGSWASPGFTADTPIEDWTDNDDGTYRLTTYGTSGPDGGPVGHYLTIEEFQRTSHEGVALDFGGNQFDYVAVRLDVEN